MRAKMALVLEPQNSISLRFCPDFLESLPRVSLGGQAGGRAGARQNGAVDSLGGRVAVQVGGAGWKGVDRAPEAHNSVSATPSLPRPLLAPSKKVYTTEPNS